MATHSSVVPWRIPGTWSLVGCRLWGRTEQDTTEATQQQQQQQQLYRHLYDGSMEYFYHSKQILHVWPLWRQPVPTFILWKSLVYFLSLLFCFSRVPCRWSNAVGRLGSAYWLPWWLSVKESTCQLQETRVPFHPWVRKIPWRRTCQPTPVFLAWEIPGTEETGGLQSTELQKSRT